MCNFYCMTAKIKLENVCKKFDKKVVLNNISLEIEEKKSLVILGRSGTGKSVLIKNICSLMKPDSGHIFIDGFDVTKIKNNEEQEKLMNKFGFLFQNGALFDSLNIWKNVAFRLLNNKKMSETQAKKIAIEKLEIVGMDEKVAELFPCELSGGMQKRVALARAIAANPEIIFFDEPTTGLDPIMSEIINQLIIKTSKIIGATTITITHDIHSAQTIADEVILLDNGRIEWSGNVKEMTKSNNELLQNFLAYSKSK